MARPIKKRNQREIQPVTLKDVEPARDIMREPFKARTGNPIIKSGEKVMKSRDKI